MNDSDAMPNAENVKPKVAPTAAFWALLFVEGIIALGAIAPCCIPVHFNGLVDVVYFSLGPNHDTDNDGLVSPWEMMGKPLAIAWIVQGTCIGIPAFVSCLGLWRQRDSGRNWGWALMVILTAFCVANLMAFFLPGGGFAFGMRYLVAVDFVAVVIMLALLCQPIYRST